MTLKERYGQDSYIVVNLIFAIIIIGVFVYSLVYSPDKNDYPVTCVHELLTGEPCASCGLSHGFSLIARGRVDEALEYNMYSVRVFAFFVAQLIMRVLTSLLTICVPDKRKWVLTIDVIITICYVFYSFWPFLKFIFRV